MTGTMQTGVSTHICCAHTGDDGRLHGHTWIITAWFRWGECAISLKDRLIRACEPFDHAELMHELSTGEGIIEALIDALPDAVAIDAARPPEGIFARWSAPLRGFDTRDEAEEWRVGQVEGVR